MADKPKTTGRDYGHRPYMNSSGYWDAMRRPTESQYDDRIKRPHSDDKKPYMEDEYPEMEYFWTPYDPPNLVPPGIPDDPRIPPNIPDNPSYGDDPEKEDEPEFTGCIWGVPVGPSVLGKGDTTFHGIKVTETDLLKNIYVNYGPVELLSTYQQANACIGSLTPNCIVSAKALDSYDPNDYHRVGDYLLAQIVGVTRKGYTCAWDLLVAVCPPDEELAWDWDNSAETIGQDDSVAIFITGGAPPFTWTVSGEGYTLRRYEGSVRYNTLYSEPDTCGSAIITVTDSCGTQVVGSVRNTTGYWNLMPAPDGSNCGLPGASGAWNIECIGGVLDGKWPIWLYVTLGYQRQYHKETLGINSAAQGAAPTQEECESNRASYNCGSWSSECLAYQSAWTLTRPPATCEATVRWTGLYEECPSPGLWTTKECTTVFGTSWSFIRAAHSDAILNYWEWECAP